MKPALLITIALCLCTLSSAQSPPPPAIVESSLPTLDAGLEFRFPLHATGGVPPYHWSVTAGDLPEGILLTADGLLTGRPAAPGTFAVTITVQDSGRPGHSINKDFQSLVTASLLLTWLRPPLIQGNRIDGAVQVSNGSRDNFDLTVFIVAVNDTGRIRVGPCPGARREQCACSLIATVAPVVALAIVGELDRGV